MIKLQRTLRTNKDKYGEIAVPQLWNISFSQCNMQNAGTHRGDVRARVLVNEYIFVAKKHAASQDSNDNCTKLH